MRWLPEMPITESDAGASYSYHRWRMFGWDDAGEILDEKNHYNNVHG